MPAKNPASYQLNFSPWRDEKGEMKTVVLSGSFYPSLPHPHSISPQIPNFPSEVPVNQQYQAQQK